MNGPKLSCLGPTNSSEWLQPLESFGWAGTFAGFVLVLSVAFVVRTLWIVYGELLKVWMHTGAPPWRFKRNLLKAVQDQVAAHDARHAEFEAADAAVTAALRRAEAIETNSLRTVAENALLRAKNAEQAQELAVKAGEIARLKDLLRRSGNTPDA